MKRMLAYAMVACVGLTGAALANSVKPDYALTVKGKDYSLVALMENCSGATGGSQAQLDCFKALTRLLKDQSVPAPLRLSVADALAALKAAAEHEDAESGLRIAANDCNLDITYFNNFFHVSRRNVSTIDLFRAQFDAASVDYGNTQKVANGAPGGWSKGMMENGAFAKVWGGAALESAEQGFVPKGPSDSMSAYAEAVAAALPVREEQAFDFMLVHPKKAQASSKIWSAFESFVSACKT